VIAALLALSSAAAAQPSEQAAAATAQFDLGRALMKQKNYPEACAAFERSQKLDPQWGTLYNLATCYAMSDRLASAWAAYRELAQRDTNPARRKESGKQAHELEKRLPRLLVTAADPPAGLVVTIDGVDVTALLGSESPVDLGRHVIRATAPGYADFERAKTIVDEARHVKVAIELRRPEHPEHARPEPAAEPPAEPRPAAPPADAGPPAERATAGAPAANRDPGVEPAAESPSRPADRPPPSRRRTYALLAAAGGGALLATGLVFGQLASSKWSDAKALCGDDLTCDNPRDLAAGNQLVDDARARANLSTALVIGGAVAASVGVVLWVTAPRGDSPPAQAALRLAPAAAPGAVSLRLEGRF
jgi:tetratricopeptide (TPR) repeat protein